MRNAYQIEKFTTAMYLINPLNIGNLCKYVHVLITGSKDKTCFRYFQEILLHNFKKLKCLSGISVKSSTTQCYPSLLQKYIFTF